MAKRAIDKITGFRAKVARLEGLAEATVQETARVLKGELARSTGAQQSMGGQAWPRRRDGTAKPVLVNAARAVAFRIQGLTVTLTLTGHYARHHLGVIRGNVRRAILPSKPDFSMLSPRIEDGATKAFRGIMR